MIAAKHPALQQNGGGRTPRPLPLFLDMVREVAAGNPELARDALTGVRLYGEAARPARAPRPIVARQGRVSLCAAGDTGPPVVLVPSLINPAQVLDLDDERSLLGWLGQSGFRAMLLDWGVPEVDERDLSIAGHVEQYLVPLLAHLGEPVHLVGYCLGGTMAAAAAQLHPVRSLTQLATPWHFSRYPVAARESLARLWATHSATVSGLGLMPIEILQTAFWGLDPSRTVHKFAALAARADDPAYLTGFALLEDWANEGAPLTAAAAHDLFDAMIGEDQPGHDAWIVAGQTIDVRQLAVPTRHFVASNDRIAPAETAADAIDALPCPSGHVGMITGRRARSGCWEPLAAWLRSVDDQAHIRS